MSETKYCNKCKETKSVTEFYIDRSYITKIGYTSKCKKCFSNYEKNKRKPILPDPTIKERKCKDCGITKNISDYYKSLRHTGGYFPMCGPCYDLRKKEKRPHFIRTKEYMIEYNKKRYSKIQDRMIRGMRVRILIELKKVNIKKTRTLKYLGCDFEFFKEWLEYQFDDKMNWENYGSYWHMDHVKPCNSYDLSKDEDINECFNWKNYRPLEGIENIIKSDKVIKSVINNHKNIVKKFLTGASKSTAAK